MLSKCGISCTFCGDIYLIIVATIRVLESDILRLGREEKSFPSHIEKFEYLIVNHKKDRKNNLVITQLAKDSFTYDKEFTDRIDAELIRIFFLHAINFCEITEEFLNFSFATFS